MGVELIELELDAELFIGVAGLYSAATVGGAPSLCSSYNEDVPLLEHDGAKLFLLDTPRLPSNGLLSGLVLPANNSSLVNMPPFCIVTLCTMSRSLLLGIRGNGLCCWGGLIPQLDIGLSSIM